ncbi:hypothetical protein HanRHA438_Chr05g0239111 [Helianthus annuus]|nr:hypothetical protein HanRHA438_Chr05g0239111 [Helianthus annuus]
MGIHAQMQYITLVSICMLSLVVILFTQSHHSLLNSPPYLTLRTHLIPNLDKFKGAILNSLVLVAVVTFITFLLVVLFYCKSLLHRNSPFTTSFHITFVPSIVSPTRRIQQPPSPPSTRLKP